MIYRKIILFLGVALILAGLAGSQVAVGAKGPDSLRPFPWQRSPLRAIDEDSTLGYDDGDPQYYFPLPDEFDDHYFNVRFTAPDSCRLLEAAFLFVKVPGDTITTLPDLHVLVWPSTGILPSVDPSEALDSVIIQDEDIVLCQGDSILDTMYVSLADLDLHFADLQKFHVGWEPDSTDTTDGQLAILADDGIPSTNYSCEWWDSTASHPVRTWGTMQSDWGRGINFMIRLKVELFDPLGAEIWINPDVPADFALKGPYPNPFNPSASFQIELSRPQEVQLQAFDLQGRLVDQILSRMLPAGRLMINWQPTNLASGAYLVVLKSPDRQIAARAVLTK